jgi:hypothetical protein
MLTPQEQERYLEMLARGMDSRTIARKILKLREENVAETRREVPEFDADIKAIKARQIKTVERSLIRSALGQATVVTKTYKIVWEKFTKDLLTKDGYGHPKPQLVEVKKQQLPPNVSAMLAFLKTNYPEVYGQGAKPELGTLDHLVDTDKLIKELDKELDNEGL